RGLAERRQRERERQHEAAEPERAEFGDRLDQQPAPPAAHVEAVHEFGEALEQLAAPDRALEQAQVEPRIEVEQDAPEALPRVPPRTFTRIVTAQLLGPYGESLRPLRVAPDRLTPY